MFMFLLSICVCLEVPVCDLEATVQATSLFVNLAWKLFCVSASRHSCVNLKGPFEMRKSSVYITDIVHGSIRDHV